MTSRRRLRRRLRRRPALVVSHQVSVCGVHVNIQRVLSPPSLPSPGLECRVLESGTAMCIECSARAVEGKLIVLCVWDLVRVLWCSVYH